MGLHPDRVAEFYRSEPGGLQRAFLDAAADFVAHRTVMVGVFDIDCTRLIRRCTGTCVSIGDRYLIATVAHLFMNIPVPHCIGIMPLAATRSRAIFVASRHNKRGGALTDKEDVAWLELNEAAARELGRTFIT